MAIDVIIPGTTPWVLSKAAPAPGETVDTAFDLNGRHMAIAEMARRGYVVGARIQQAAADVEADTKKLATLRNVQAGNLNGLDFSTPQAAQASRDLLTSVGANLTHPDIPHTGTVNGMTVSEWWPNSGTHSPVTNGYRQLTLALPIKVVDLTQTTPNPLANLVPVSVPPPAVIDPAYVDTAGNLFYVVRHPSGSNMRIYLGGTDFYATSHAKLANVTHTYPTGPFTDAQAKVIAASIDPAKLDAEIEKTIQISQGKQVYLQSLTTDYSNFYTTAGNLMQDYLKLLSSMISRIG